MPPLPPVVRCLRKLNAFNPVRRALHELEITSSNWNDLQALLQSRWSSRLDELLTNLHSELVLHGRKSIILYDISETLRSRLLSKRIQFQSQALPIVPDPESNEAPRLVSIIDTADERLFAFWSSRHLRKEQRIDLSTLGKSVPDSLKTLDELWGFTYERESAFDVVAIPRHAAERAQVRIHQSSHNRMYPSEGDVRGLLMIEMGQIAGGQPSLGQQVNVFPAIAKIYAKASEGRIVGLRFWCDSTARRHEYLPSRSQGDLRKEDYHKAGVIAVNKAIDIFSLQVQWDQSSDKTDLLDARIELDGSGLTLQQQQLSTISVPCLVGKRELDFILHRLSVYA